VRVVRFSLPVPAELAASARAELLDRGREPAGAAFRFGYLLGVELEALPELPALARRGVSVPRGDYQVVELPPDVPVEVVEIPGLQPGALHALAFQASVVPHVGVDGPDGHFLASYEAVTTRPVSTR
jgi:hypothetical protein